MPMRLPCLLAAAVLALPMSAHADCAARIATVEAHPAIGGSADAAEGSVRTDGGDSTHAAGGPATPTESWFTDAEHEDRPSALTHLHSAREAQKEGDEQACLDAVEQAEAALEGR